MNLPLGRLARLVIAGLALAWAGASPGADPPGLVIDVQGEATLVGKGRVAILNGLAPGAELALAPGARVVVVDSASGRQFELAGPGAFRWAGGKVEVVRPGQLVVREAADGAFADLRLRTARIAQASITMRGLPAQSPVRLTSPVSTWLLERPKAFRWEPVAGVASYRFQLTDSDGRSLHEARTAAAFVDLPPGVPLEAGRTYGWQVQAVGVDARTLEGWSEFGVAAPELRARVDRARPGPGASFGDRVLYALLLDEFGVREEAGRLWSQLARERPGDPDLAARAQGAARR